MFLVPLRILFFSSYPLLGLWKLFSLIILNILTIVNLITRQVECSVRFTAKLERLGPAMNTRNHQNVIHGSLLI